MLSTFAIFAFNVFEHTMEDRFLIIRLNCSSKQAFAGLYKKYVGKIYNYVHSLTHDKVITEDIVQFCFMKVWEHRTDIRPNDNFSAYLYTIARNAVYKETRRTITSANYVDYMLHSSQEAVDSTMDQLNFSLLQEEIHKVIDRLPESRRLIYAMSTEEMLNNKEIALKLNISVKTVETQLNRVKKAIRSHIAKYF